MVVRLCNKSLGLLIITIRAGEVLIRKYSLVGMVMKLFPEHEWKPWKFVQAPHGWWDVPENRIRFLKDLETTLGITKLEDWYKVTPAQIREHRGMLIFIGIRVLC